MALRPGWLLKTGRSWCASDAIAKIFHPKVGQQIPVRGRRRPVFSEMTSLDGREVAAEHVFLRKARLLETSLNFRKLPGRLRITTLLRNLASQMDKVTEPILQV